MGPLLVTPEDHDAGFKEVPLKYRRSPASDAMPATIRIRALSYVEAAAINEKLRELPAQDEAAPRLDESIWRLSVLLAALPEPHNNVEFVNRIKPTCVERLVLVALHLAYGAPDGELESGKKNMIDSPVSVPA